MAVTRILKIQEVLHRCSISRSSLYRLISKGHFPSQLRLSPEGRSVGWLEEDIEGWISSRKSINDGKLT
ncbi:AlpA family transcriptional regulator [Salmonella enterica]|uniref:AlpA family transcriptional regulator n=1 Tax=Salmonella enterica TaxID=28901 RepID=A0A5T8JPP5_SALER|nr:MULTISPECIES: AlpA family transcriptional regulator [Enterobacterales]EAO3108652.1 AlpA family transcriptional regulator [Salmonella enterica]ECB7137477.1 AlpA family transcriptional regulator [Salmonella enterica subsp. enterica serovar Virchow]EDS4155653.1 AlpA family transcriptional regulator [Salmonella enterica subsp. enterica serovar Gaminara]EDT7665922.1 AlpA family transcriptional regulator [Salmonella enterica subsp. enterica serovar Waycross]EJM2134793.1 AlpA family transcriptiona